MEKVARPFGTFFHCAPPKDTQHNAKQKAFLVYCPPCCLSSLRASVSGAGLFVPRCTERHGRIVSAAEEENGTVTVERIGS